MKAPVPWSLKEVLAVHLLRLLSGLFLVRVIYPLWFHAAPWVVEITDRVIMVGLVWLVIHKHGGNLADWGLSLQRPVSNFAVGLSAGAVLLAVSVFSERVYTTVFFSSSQHPLIAQVEQAASWRDLALPLLLGGLAAPVAEEMLYRLFTFSSLQVRVGLWGGALGSAAIFALFHFNVYWLAELITVGIGLALLYAWTGSLLCAIVAHSFINTAKMALLYFHVAIF